MVLILRPHPGRPCAAIDTISVESERPHSSRMRLRYRVAGRIAALRLPDPAAPERADGLWQHTCFEAFVRAGDGPAYFEFNFSPSRRWAAYRFRSYRDGMAPVDGMDAPRITTQAADGHYMLCAVFNLEQIVPPREQIDLHVGLSAVIEETSGDKSYWALTHPPGEPDFHHADGFAHKLSVERV